MANAARSSFSMYHQRARAPPRAEGKNTPHAPSFWRCLSVAMCNRHETEAETLPGTGRKEFSQRRKCMATNLLATVMNYLTPEVMQKLSSLTGESPANTQRAVEGAVPTLLAGLTNFSTSGDGAT